MAVFLPSLRFFAIASRRASRNRSDSPSLVTSMWSSSLPSRFEIRAFIFSRPFCAKLICASNSRFAVFNAFPIFSVFSRCETCRARRFATPEPRSAAKNSAAKRSFAFFYCGDFQLAKALADRVVRRHSSGQVSLRFIRQLRKFHSFEG